MAATAQKRMLARHLAFFAFVAALTLFSQPAAAQNDGLRDEVVTLDTRPGVKQSFLLLKPQGEVKGVVLVFPGHEGVVHFVKSDGGYEVTNEGGGFTARKATRELAAGYTFAHPNIKDALQGLVHDMARLTLARTTIAQFLVLLHGCRKGGLHPCPGLAIRATKGHD